MGRGFIKTDLKAINDVAIQLIDVGLQKAEKFNIVNIHILIVLYLGIQIRLGLSISFRLQKRTITDMKY